MTTLAEHDSWIERAGPIVTEIDDPNLDLLHPVLRDHVVELQSGSIAIKHPWINMCFGILVGQANLAYAANWAAARRYLPERNFHGYLFVVIERPWRIDWLVRMWERGKITHDELRDLLPEVWIDGEFIGEQQHDPTWLFHEAGFVADAVEEWDAMGDQIEIWRGGPEGGASWTTSRETAEFFAKRFALDEGTWPLWRATIAKTTALAYLTGRGEAEVIVDPDEVDWEEA